MISDFSTLHEWWCPQGIEKEWQGQMISLAATRQYTGHRAVKVTAGRPVGGHSWPWARREVGWDQEAPGHIYMIPCI